MVMDQFKQQGDVIVNACSTCLGALLPKELTDNLHLKRAYGRIVCGLDEKRHVGFFFDPLGSALLHLIRLVCETRGDHFCRSHASACTEFAKSGWLLPPVGEIDGQHTGIAELFRSTAADLSPYRSSNEGLFHQFESIAALPTCLRAHECEIPVTAKLDFAQRIDRWRHDMINSFVNVGSLLTKANSSVAPLSEIDQLLESWEQFSNSLKGLALRSLWPCWTFGTILVSPIKAWCSIGAELRILNGTPSQTQIAESMKEVGRQLNEIGSAMNFFRNASREELAKYRLNPLGERNDEL